MWQAVQYVTSGFTLCAFIVAALVSFLKRRSQDELKRIELALPEQRATLVSETLEFFRVDTSGLTKHQQFEIAMKQISARIERFRLIAILIVLLAFVGAGLSAFSIAKSAGPRISDPQPKVPESPPHSSSTGSGGMPPTQPSHNITVPGIARPNGEAGAGEGGTEVRPPTALRLKFIAHTNSMADLNSAEAQIEEKLNSYTNQQLIEEAQLFCKDLAVLALHWGQDINEYDLAETSHHAGPPEHDRMTGLHSNEYSMRYWPEAQAIRVAIASRLSTEKMNRMTEQLSKGADLFNSRYLREPPDVETIRSYLEALAQQLKS